MLNVYVHLDVHGLPAHILDRDGFLDALWRELPDAAVGEHTHDHVVTITLSQYSLRGHVAARRQSSRAQSALAALGWPDATVRTDKVIREGVRDDLRCVVGAIRWRLTH